MTPVSAGHIILIPTQPVGSGRPRRGSNPGPPDQEARALLTKLLRPPINIVVVIKVIVIVVVVVVVVKVAVVVVEVIVAVAVVVVVVLVVGVDGEGGGAVEV